MKLRFPARTTPRVAADGRTEVADTRLVRERGDPAPKRSATRCSRRRAACRDAQRRRPAPRRPRTRRRPERRDDHLGLRDELRGRVRNGGARSSRGRRFARLRLWTTSGYPASRRRSAIAVPMLPSPINPTVDAGRKRSTHCPGRINDGPRRSSRSAQRSHVLRGPQGRRLYSRTTRGRVGQVFDVAAFSTRSRSRLSAGHSSPCRRYVERRNRLGSVTQGSFERVKMWTSGLTLVGSSSVPARTNRMRGLVYWL